MAAAVRVQCCCSAAMCRLASATPPPPRRSHRPIRPRPPPPAPQVLRLWEALWASTPGMHLYLSMAVLEHHRRRILRCAHPPSLGAFQ